MDKEQKRRLEVYKEYLDIYKNDIHNKIFDASFFDEKSHIYYYGFCSIFGRFHMNDNYPELWKQKPSTRYKPHSGFWWNPHSPKRRIQALKDAIKLCE